MKVLSALASTAVLTATALTSTPAEAKQVCGWYAIAYCSTSNAAVVTFANNGWGQVINTSNYRGFAPGKFCAVSGPQSKSSADSDRRAALNTGATKSAYIKNACTDEANLGD